MTSVTITQLPTATLPLVGTEVFPIVRSGTTYQTTVASVATAPQTGATINGVAYYDASKILSSGALLTFDGATVVAPSYTFNATTTASSTKGALNYGTLGFSDTGIVQSAQTSVNSYFQNVMQNTNSGASASAEYIVYNNNGTASTNYAAFGINSSGYSGTGSINAPGYGFFVTASTDLVLGTIGANNIHFTTNSSASDAMIINPSGNVGVGAAPSAWSSFNAVLQQRGGSHVVGDTGAFMQIGANSYFNGANWIYTTTAPATRFTQSNGLFQWYSAASGTAGNAITFTQPMTLDASGNLLIGTTSSPAGSKELVLGGDYIEGVVAIGTVTTASTISLANGTLQTATLTASTACTFTMPTAVAGKSFMLLLKQAAVTGNGTATFTGVKWTSAGSPTITALAGKMDILSFVSDGTNWYGSYTQGYTP